MCCFSQIARVSLEIARVSDRACPSAAILEACRPGGRVGQMMAYIESRRVPNGYRGPDGVVFRDVNSFFMPQDLPPDDPHPTWRFNIGRSRYFDLQRIHKILIGEVPSHNKDLATAFKARLEGEGFRTWTLILAASSEVMNRKAPTVKEAAIRSLGSLADQMAAEKGGGGAAEKQGMKIIMRDGSVRYATPVTVARAPPPAPAEEEEELPIPLRRPKRNHKPAVMETGGEGQREQGGREGGLGFGDGGGVGAPAQEAARLGQGGRGGEQGGGGVGCGVRVHHRRVSHRPGGRGVHGGHRGCQI